MGVPSENLLRLPFAAKLGVHASAVQASRKSMIHREFAFEATQETRLFAQSWEPDEHPSGAVAIIHGLGDHSGRFAYLAERFVDAGFYAVSVDLRGHGKSPGPRGHVAGYDLLLDDIDVLVSHARDHAHNGPVVVYGQSLGGNLTLNYVVRRQPTVDGIIVSSPLLLPFQPPPAWKVWFGRMINRVRPQFTFHAGLSAAQLSQDPSAIAAHAADEFVHSSVSARLAVEMLQAGRWVRDRAADIRIPLLLMHGEADHITDPRATREFAERVDNCRLQMWPGLRHELHWERERAEVVQVMVDWLSNFRSSSDTADQRG